MEFGDPQEPDAAEIDEFLDDAIGVLDDGSSEESDEDDDESTDERESPSEDDDDDDESDESDDDEDDELAGVIEPDEPDAATLPADQQVALLRQVVIQQQRQNQQAERARTVLAKLQTIRTDYLDKGDEDGWNKFQGQLVGGFKDHMLGQAIRALKQRDERDSQARLDQAEKAAQKVAIDHFDKKFKGFSKTERHLLEATATPKAFMAALRTIKTDRKGRTEPARQELRNKRERSRADATHARSRGSGGGKSSNKGDDYNNFTDLDRYLDDVLSA